LELFAGGRRGYSSCKTWEDGLPIWDDVGEIGGENIMSGTKRAAATARADAAAKPWLGSYPSGVPAEIDTARIGTLVDLFRQSGERYRDRPALESFGKQLTYADLSEAADAVAAWLQAKGFGKGDRVAIMLPNVLAYPAILFGTLIAGGTVVNVNPLYTARELSHQLEDAGARVLFVGENFGHTVEKALPRLKLDAIVVVTPGDLMGLKGTVVNLVSRRVKKAVQPFHLPEAETFGSVLAIGRKSPPNPVAIATDDIAFLQYTGGTTGIAKGAVLLHRNVVANVAQIEAWMRPFIGTEAQHVIATALPLYHIFALTGCCLFACRIGACQILIANPHDLSGLVKTLKARPATGLLLVNTLYNALANHSQIGTVDLSKLAFCIAGGMATQAAVAKRWKALTGKPIIEGYGLSETSPVVCMNRPDLEEFSGTIGYPLPSTDVSIRSGDGRALPPGEAGELCVKGPQVMAGYWNRADETARAMTPDGYFRTGDVVVLRSDGEVKLVDRMKDLIIVSGFNVYPNEVEAVLASHPGVLEVAVIGVPDAHAGEVAGAYIVPKDPNLTVQDIRAYCRENLTGYKIPRRVEFRDSLPKTSVGKVLRRALRDEVLGALEKP
jgi:long-chain acyl-CoA synthetase